MDPVLYSVVKQFWCKILWKQQKEAWSQGQSKLSPSLEDRRQKTIETLNIQHCDPHAIGGYQSKTELMSIYPSKNFHGIRQCHWTMK